MKGIYKYIVPIGEIRTVHLPVNTDIIHFDLQNGHPIFWAEHLADEIVDKSKYIGRKFRVYGTGDFSVPENAIHLGSALDGPFVWHLYELTKISDMLH